MPLPNSTFYTEPLKLPHCTSSTSIPLGLICQMFCLGCTWYSMHKIGREKQKHFFVGQFLLKYALHSWYVPYSSLFYHSLGGSEWSGDKLDLDHASKSFKSSFFFKKKVLIFTFIFIPNLSHWHFFKESRSATIQQSEIPLHRLCKSGELGCQMPLEATYSILNHRLYNIVIQNNISFQAKNGLNLFSWLLIQNVTSL